MQRRTRWALACFTLASACAADDSLMRINGRTMGTTYSVTIAPPRPAGASAPLKAAIQRRLDELEATLSTYRPTSTVCRFNTHRGTDWFAVEADTAAVVERAQRISAETDGAFDITLHPLVSLWGFGPDPAPAGPPSAAAIARARQHVSQRKLEVRLTPPALRKLDPEISLDLSGIAKGFAVEAVARVLERAGVAHFLIAVGGEIRVRGAPPGQRNWRVGLERPERNGTEVDRVLELTDAAVSTSGDYRNFFDHSGRRYSHLLDPRTGEPVTGALSSVSVVDSDSTRADAIATALMVMGETAGPAWAEAHDLACLFFLRTPSGLRALPSKTFAHRFGAAP